MSRIDDLIRSSAKGVQFKPLGEVGEFIRGDGCRRPTSSTMGCRAFTTARSTRLRRLATTRSRVTPSQRRRCACSAGDVIIAAISETVEDVGKAVAWLGDRRCRGPRRLSSFAPLDPKFVVVLLAVRAFHAEEARAPQGRCQRRLAKSNSRSACRSAARDRASARPVQRAGGRPSDAARRRAGGSAAPVCLLPGRPVASATSRRPWVPSAKSGSSRTASPTSAGRSGYRLLTARHRPWRVASGKTLHASRLPSTTS